jgi:hypothetical protein
VVQLVELTANTEYYFRARSKDAAGNEVVTSIQSFRTRLIPDVANPKFVVPPRVIGKTDSTATIYWETDEPADSVLEYGEGQSMTHQRSEGGKKKKHQITLAGLAQNSSYSFVCGATDTSGNRAEYSSLKIGLGNDGAIFQDKNLFAAIADFMVNPAVAAEPGGFVTDAVPDATPPTITLGPELVTVSANHALIRWVTDEAADSRIEFGVTGGARDRVSGELDYGTEHLMVITNLDPGMTYDYQVRSVDVAGNAVASAVLELTTPAQPDTTAPSFTAVPSMTALSDDEAVATWATDEYASAEVECLITGTSLAWRASSEGLQQSVNLRLSDLNAGTEYDCVAISRDIAGNELRSGVLSLVTSGQASDSDGDGVSDALDAFPLDPDESADTDLDTVGNTADTDDDNDGIPDDVELANGLNPLNSADATLDSDADGISNLDEYLGNTDIGSDSTPPVLMVPSDMVVNATGVLTMVDVGVATATDTVDGVVTPTPDKASPFVSGSHSVTWTATDSAGNSVQGSQMIEITPQVNLGPDQFLGEGSTVRVPVLLNGEAASYPVTIPYTVSGTATNPEDHDLVSATLTLTSGTSGYIVYQVVDDGVNNEGQERVVISLESPTNAVIGQKGSHTVTIVEENLPPRVQLVIDQNGNTSREFSLADGVVTVRAQVADPNPGDGHGFDWGLTDNNLVDTDGDITNDTLVFDPGSLSSGVYRLQVQVTDDGVPSASVLAQLDIRVVQSMPVLSNTADSDGDGLSDSVEGLNDDDSDGLPDYLDRYANHIMPALRETQDRYLVETEPGFTIRIGQTAFAANTGDLTVEQAQIDSHARTGAGVDTQDNVSIDGSYFDFEIANLPQTGQSARVVIPLLAQIPENPVYRKFMPNTGWQDFVADANNGIASAPGVQGICPPPSDAAYIAGLTPGYWCIQLTLEDGGANDADYEANAVISDPGGVGTVVTAASAPVVDSTDGLSSPPSSSSGGGCSIQQDGRPDPTLPLLVLYAVFYLIRWRYLKSKNISCACSSG